MRCFFVMLFSLATLAGCAPDKKTAATGNTMKTSASGKIVIYQMMTRLFGNKTAAKVRYGTIEENGAGKFNDIDSAALEGIKELGTTHIWYTGVIEHATLTDYTRYGIPLDDADVVKGRAGSPYAIKDYYDINPDLAVDVQNRMHEFEDLIARTHNHGFKVIIDFVPNHVARAYHSDAKPEGVQDLGENDNRDVSFDRNNNFYYLPGQSFSPPPSYNPLGGLPHPTKDGKFQEMPAKVTGNDAFTPTPDINSWFETVKLNYGVDIQNGRQTYFEPIPNTWMKMRDILLFWTSKGVDGFRCDMAEMVPVEFWHWVIPQIKEKNEELIFIAEIYNPQQYRSYIEHGAFDFLYDKVLLYDTLRLLINRKRTTADIAQIQDDLDGIRDHMLHFLENHDEQRIASAFFAGDPWKAVPAMVISATIDKGPIMIYFGQEVGEPAAGAAGFQSDDGRTTIYDYWHVPEHQKWMNDGKFDGGKLSDEQTQLRRFYCELLSFVGSSEAIREGAYADITRFNISKRNFADDVHAFLRFSENERLLIINSFNHEPRDIVVEIPPGRFAEMRLDTAAAYIARDMLWREVEVGLTDKLSFQLTIKPYSSFIFKIK